MRNRLRRLARVVGVVVVVVAFIAVAIVIGRLFRHRQSSPQRQAPPFPPYSSAFVRSGAPWDESSRARLVADIRPIVNDAVFPATSAAIVVDPRTGALLYSRNSSMPLTPASTLKLIVTATALHDLGAGYRFATSVVTDAHVSGGVLQGDLYLVGSGDPELLSTDLRAAVHTLKLQGIQTIQGDVVADASAFGPDLVNPTWGPGDLEYGWAAPPSALTMDGGSVQFTITPDADGGLARIAVDPRAAAGRIIGGVKTAGNDDDNTLQIDPLPDGSGFTLSGQIPYGAPQQYWRAIAHPTHSASLVLRSMLNDAGIRVTGVATTGTAPPNATVLWTHRSRPLSQIIRKMAFDSDNHIAEQLLRAVGQETAGVGTLANGLSAEHAYLASMQTDDPHIRLIDGSGLSPDDRVSVAVLAAALRSVLAGPDAAQAVTLLPRVGIDGTVSSRVLADDVIGRIFGKDGYIEGASGLAGFIRTAHHGVVVYAFLVDGWQQGLDAVWSGEDDAISKIARL